MTTPVALASAERGRRDNAPSLLLPQAPPDAVHAAVA